MSLYDTGSGVKYQPLYIRNGWTLSTQLYKGWYFTPLPIYNDTVQPSYIRVGILRHSQYITTLSTQQYIRVGISRHSQSITTLSTQLYKGWYFTPLPIYNDTVHPAIYKGWYLRHSATKLYIRVGISRHSQSITTLSTQLYMGWYFTPLPIYNDTVHPAI